MDSFDDLEQPQPDRKVRQCKTCLALDDMDDDQRAKVEAAIARPMGDPLYWDSPSLADRLKRAGFDVSEPSIRGHRKNHV